MHGHRQARTNASTLTDTGARTGGHIARTDIHATRTRAIARKHTRAYMQARTHASTLAGMGARTDGRTDGRTQHAGTHKWPLPPFGGGRHAATSTHRASGPKERE